jgi:transposase InsO family protein
VTKSHSRPHTSDNNPFSEAQFKTLKYRLDYPERFESLADAREWVTAFFDWYNNEHRQSSLGLMTPAAVHWGLDRPADGGNPSVNRRTVRRRGGVKGRRLFADLRSP